LIQYHTGDILIICDEVTKSILDKSYLNLKFMITESISSFKSSSNKLKIYEYIDIKNYDFCCYIDSDILVINNIDNLFNDFDFDFIIHEEFSHYGNVKMHGHELSGGSDCHGRNLFSFEELDLLEKESVNGINGGFFLFKVVDKNLNILKEISDHCLSDSEKGIIYDCLEQPYINYHFYIKKCYKVTNLVKSWMEFDMKKEKSDGTVLLHLFGNIGNRIHKIKIMKKTIE
jgi:hypothetical protein